MDRAFVYMLTNKPRGVLYVGISNQNLARRIWEHHETKASRFTSRYNLERLVWFEACADVTEAAAFERRLKRWRRDWKIALVERANPKWRDLYLEICG